MRSHWKGQSGRWSPTPICGAGWGWPAVNGSATISTSSASGGSRPTSTAGWLWSRIPDVSEEAVRYTGAMVVEDWMIRTGLALLALNAVNGLLFWGIRRRNRRLRRPPATTRETTSAPDGDP